MRNFLNLALAALAFSILCPTAYGQRVGAEHAHKPPGKAPTLLGPVALDAVAGSEVDTDVTLIVYVDDIRDLLFAESPAKW